MAEVADLVFQTIGMITVGLFVALILWFIVDEVWPSIRRRWLP